MLTRTLVVIAATASLAACGDTTRPCFAVVSAPSTPSPSPTPSASAEGDNAELRTCDTSRYVPVTSYDFTGKL